MSFPEIMVSLVFVTGIIWLIDSLFFARHRVQENDPVVVEYAKSFFPIILVVLVIRSFIAEPFRIPSGSMLPTLHIGDFILVNKFSYGVRLPVLHTKIVEMGKPKRGDVVVFRFPKNPKVDYIKRVVGLPGDKVGYFNKTLYINDKMITQNAKEKGEQIAALVPTENILSFERLGEFGHDILTKPTPQVVEGETIIPEGEYFVMGDNRDNSNDSRFWGTVPEGNLVGQAFFIWMSWNSSDGYIVWDRLGKNIQ